MCGCNVDFAQMRDEHARSFGAEMDRRTAEALGADSAVGLGRCVTIALANNLNVKTAEIEARLATLDRKIAFASFLPQVDVDWSYNETHRPSIRKAAGTQIQMSDRFLTDYGVSVQMPLFMPQTWFLYSVREKGEEISRYVKRRTEQLITLRVVALYYACLSQEEVRSYLEASVKESQALLKEMTALEREGLVLSSDREAVEAMALARQKALDDNLRNERDLKAQLLETMGLSPLAEVKLKGEPALESPAGELADQVLEALLRRPELHVADRTIEIRKDELRMAIADFLPVISGYTRVSRSSDSFLKYATTWAYGASAVLTVFDGFANLYRYQEARERQAEAFIERERLCLSIMLEVLTARHQADEAASSMAVATKQRQAAEAKLKSIEAQWREGLIDTSERLDALALRDGAVAQESAARYRQQVAWATLMDVQGHTKEWSKP
jgi:outer membrane protein TolC